MLARSLDKVLRNFGRSINTDVFLGEGFKTILFEIFRVLVFPSS